VNHVSLDIAQGEFFSLLGSSGCGKSTLLRMIAGLEMPSSGRVIIDGHDVTHLSAHRRPTNMMFQSYALFPHLNIAQNIAFGLKQERLPQAEITKRMEDAQAKLQLDGLMARKPDQLSGGQRQRVALARALVKRPRVLLLDEPLAALDKNLRAETQNELLRLQRELNITFIVVTHDQEEAMTLSSRLAIMRAGEILQIGTPEQIYEAPDSRYIAKFLGETNIFTIDKARREGERLILHGRDMSGQITCPCPQYLFNQLSEGKPLWLSVRPERVTLSKTPPAKEQAFKARIEQITYTGIKRHYRLRLPSGFVVDSVQINQGGGDDFTVNDEAFVHWQPEAARILTQ